MTKYRNISLVKISLVREKALPYKAGAFKVSCSRDVFLFCRDVLKTADLAAEELLVLSLDNKKSLTSVFVAAKGSSTQAHADMKEIFKAVLLSNADGFILVHNHPSGNSTPSAEDIALTRRVKEAAVILGLSLVDHVILGDEAYTSLAELGIC